MFAVARRVKNYGHYRANNFVQVLGRSEAGSNFNPIPTKFVIEVDSFIRNTLYLRRARLRFFLHTCICRAL